MKICRHCGVDISKEKKWLIRIYLCRQCAKNDWNKNRKIRKERGTLKTHKMPLEYHKEYHAKWSKNNRFKQNEYAKRARLKYPQKYTARNVLNKAVKSFKIIKTACVVCGNVKSEAHHKDYSKPLEVIWLCKKHHNEIHKKATN